MNALTDILPPVIRKWMNFGYAMGVAVLGVWAAVLTALDAPISPLYKAAAAAWLAVGGYLGLQSGSNVNTETDPATEEFVEPDESAPADSADE